jgi:hypothetical protein
VPLKNVFGKRAVTKDIGETFNNTADFIKFVTHEYAILAAMHNINANMNKIQYIYIYIYICFKFAFLRFIRISNCIFSKSQGSLTQPVVII